jgi:hypothetical protein
MANRRMFNKEIVNSDAFTSMPISSQALYFHLGMEADDDGFVNNPLRVARTINVGGDDLKVLILKKFLIDFQTGIVVIKHWRKNNQIRYDRYNETNYLEEASKLFVKKDGTYTIDADNIGVIPFMATKKQPDSNQWLPQYSVVKSSSVQLSEVKESKEKKDSSKNVYTDKPTNEKDFMESMDLEASDTRFTELERLIRYNFKLVKGEMLKELEQRMLIDWIKEYPYEYIESMIKRLSLGDDAKKNFRYLNGAIVKGFNEWKAKPTSQPNNELDSLIDQVLKEKE